MTHRSFILALCVISTGISNTSFAQTVTAPSPAEHKILSRAQTFFGIHFDLHPGLTDTTLGADVSDVHIAHVLDRIKPDFVQYDCKGHAGILGFKSQVGPAAPGIVNDSLAVWRKQTLQRGISLYIHFSGLFDIRALEIHPEWAAIDAAGKRSTQATSTFGPYVDRLMIPQLVEAIQRYDLDGAWVDGECWAAILDYSPAALEAWRRETGYTEAPKGRQDPHWAEWKAFHRRHFEDYVARWVDAVHAARPGVQLASNWLYTTFTPQPVRVKVDFLSGDYDASMSVDRARVEARYLASTGLPWDLIAWGFLQGHDGFGHNLKPAMHLQQEAAVVLMQGGGVQIYYQPTRAGYVNETIVETAGQVADFCRARQKVSHRSRSVPQVALVFSTAAILDRGDALGHLDGTYREMIGALHGLLESHYSVDILAEHQLAPRLDDYPLVVLPDFDRFEDKLLKALPEYVQRGGRLLLMGPRCARLFAPLLGVKLQGEPQQVAAELPSSSGGLANVNGAWQNVTLAGASAIGHRFATRKTSEGGQVAASLTSHGKGKVAAIYGPVAVYFLAQHNPYVREFIKDVACAVFSEPAVKVDGPACVEISLRTTATGELSVHFLNRANMPTSLQYELIDYIAPSGPLGVQLNVPTRPDKVELVPSNTRLEWTWSQGVLKTTIPKVGIHEVLVVR